MMNREQRVKKRLGRILTKVIDAHVSACGYEVKVAEAVSLEFGLLDEIGKEIREAWEAGKRGEA